MLQLPEPSIASIKNIAPPRPPLDGRPSSVLPPGTIVSDPRDAWLVQPACKRAPKFREWWLLRHDACLKRAGSLQREINSSVPNNGTLTHATTAFWIALKRKSIADKHLTKLRAELPKETIRCPRFQVARMAFTHEPIYANYVSEINKRIDDSIKDASWMPGGKQTNIAGAKLRRIRWLVGLKADTEDLLNRQNESGFWNAQVEADACANVVSHLRYTAFTTKPASRKEALLGLRFIRDCEIAGQSKNMSRLISVMSQNVANLLSGETVSNGYSWNTKKRTSKSR